MFAMRWLNAKISTNTAWFKVKLLHGYVASQIYFHKSGFAVGYHLPKADDHHVGPTLATFISEYGIPSKLTMDGAAVQVGRKTSFMMTIQRNQINYAISQPYQPREIKRRFYRLQQKYG